MPATPHHPNKLVHHSERRERGNRFLKALREGFEQRERAEADAQLLGELPSPGNLVPPPQRRQRLFRGVHLFPRDRAALEHELGGREAAEHEVAVARWEARRRLSDVGGHDWKVAMFSYELGVAGGLIHRSCFEEARVFGKSEDRLTAKHMRRARLDVDRGRGRVSSTTPANARRARNTVSLEGAAVNALGMSPDEARRAAGLPDLFAAEEAAHHLARVWAAATPTQRRHLEGLLAAWRDRPDATLAQAAAAAGLTNNTAKLLVSRLRRRLA